MVIGQTVENGTPARHHAVVWIDHLAAKVFFVGLTGVDEVVLHSDLPTKHLHHKANSIGSGHLEQDLEYFRRIAETIASAGEILLVGPGGEKTALMKYLKENRTDVAGHVVKVAPADHPTDAEVVALAKRYFRMQPRAS